MEAQVPAVANPGSPSSTTTTAVAESAKSKEPSSASSLATLTRPPNVPAVAASNRTVNEVDSPGASGPGTSPGASEKPAGRLIPPGCRADVPTLRIVNVRVTGLPTSVVPRATEPVPSARSTAPSSTWTSGPDG